MKARGTGCSALLLAALGSVGCEQGSSAPSAQVFPPTSGAILFFYDAHCPDCTVVKADLLAPFAATMGLSLDDVVSKDVARPEVAVELLDLERRLGFETETLAPVIVAQGRADCGLEAIRRVVGEE